MKEIVNTDERAAVRMAAIAKIEDNDFLYRLVLNDSMQAVGITAARRITDVDYLIEIINGNHPKEICGGAINALKCLNLNKLNKSSLEKLAVLHTGFRSDFGYAALQELKTSACGALGHIVDDGGCYCNRCHGAFHSYDKHCRCVRCGKTNHDYILVSTENGTNWNELDTFECTKCRSRYKRERSLLD